jgi:hypothetical protein
MHVQCALKPCASSVVGTAVDECDAAARAKDGYLRMSYCRTAQSHVRTGRFTHHTDDAHDPDICTLPP